MNNIRIEGLLEKIQGSLKETLLILKLQNKEILERTIAEVASTKERKIMWTLLDGKIHTDKIAEKIGKNKRTVQYFVNDLVQYGLVNPMRGYPRRLLNYVPPEWLKLEVKKEERTDERENTEQTE